MATVASTPPLDPWLHPRVRSIAAPPVRHLPLKVVPPATRFIDSGRRSAMAAAAPCFPSTQGVGERTHALCASTRTSQSHREQPELIHASTAPKYSARRRPRRNPESPYKIGPCPSL